MNRSQKIATQKYIPIIRGWCFTIESIRMFLSKVNLFEIIIFITYLQGIKLSSAEMISGYTFTFSSFSSDLVRNTNAIPRQ